MSLLRAEREQLVESKPLNYGVSHRNEIRYILYFDGYRPLWIEPRLIVSTCVMLDTPSSSPRGLEGYTIDFDNN